MNQISNVPKLYILGTEVIDIVFMSKVYIVLEKGHIYRLWSLVKPQSSYSRREEVQTTKFI